VSRGLSAIAELLVHTSCVHCSRKRLQQSTKRKKSRFSDFVKNVKNVKT